MTVQRRQEIERRQIERGRKQRTRETVRAGRMAMRPATTVVHYTFTAPDRLLSLIVALVLLIGLSDIMYIKAGTDDLGGTMMELCLAQGNNTHVAANATSGLGWSSNDSGGVQGRYVRISDMLGDLQVFAGDVEKDDSPLMIATGARSLLKMVKEFAVYLSSSTYDQAVGFLDWLGDQIKGFLGIGG